MASEDVRIEQSAHDIVVDAYASSAGIDHERVTPEMLVSDLDSLELQEFIMETEDQCDALSVLKNQGHFSLPDKALKKARTIADVIAITTARIESMLHE